MTRNRNPQYTVAGVLAWQQDFTAGDCSVFIGGNINLTVIYNGTPRRQWTSTIVTGPYAHRQLRPDTATPCPQFLEQSGANVLIARPGDRNAAMELQRLAPTVWI
jgi:hypothetical protein